MNRKYNLKLDLQFRCNNSTMKFNQFDNNTSDFFMRITNGGNLVDIEKAIVVLAIIKPSGKVASQFVEVENGLVYADLKPNMRDEIGTYTAKAMLILEDERVVTDSISYNVEEDKVFSLLNDSVEDTEDFTLLTDMLSRLSTIEISEEQRIVNEAERILSEENRKIEEAKRVEAELIRQHEEADRAKYDATRESNENIRKQNESIRLANETNRMDEETKRVEEEANRVEAEQLRNANYNFMTEDEERRRLEANAHKEAEVLRVQAETNRVNEEAKRRTTEQARVSAENTRVSNENTRKDNETTRQTNETHRVEAETQRQNRYNSFIADAEANANNFENYTNNAKIKEEERKSNELNRKSQEDRRVSNEVERISNENTRKANEVAREKNETSRQYVFENKVNEVDKKIIEINTTKDNFVSNINTKVDTKISEIDNVKDNFVSSVNTKVDSKISELDNAKSDMTTTVSNKVNEVETRFNALTASQQQSSEVIDARDGETSLKARLDRDIEKAKEIYVNVEGSHISTDSSVGYLKDVEILGNTIQSASNLADIRSVGDKVEGQELYEIPVLSSNARIQKMDGTNPVKNTLLDIPHGSYVYELDENFNIISNSSGHQLSFLNNNFEQVDFFTMSKNPRQYTFAYPKEASYIKYASNNKVKYIAVIDELDLNYKFIEDKLTILSPTPLEKVGDVRDRIIEKNGVWGVEKNIKTKNINTNIFNKRDLNNNTYARWYNANSDEFMDCIFNKQINGYCDKYQVVTDADSQKLEKLNLCLLGGTGNYRITMTTPVEIDTTVKLNNYISSNPFLIKYPTTQPTFIPLPHDQQIKLRTFAGKTNISFGCEIEGTIKAQVPKSLGATVNTHTEQINNLNKELDRVKKLEESTVSTVTTESDFTTVEATSNGYFEDVKLEGKTLVNLAPKYSIKWTHSGTWLSKFLIGTKNPSNHYDKIIQDLKPNTEYTVIVNIKTNTQSGNIDLNNYQNNTCVFNDNMFIKPSDIGVKTFKVKTVESFDNINPSDIVILRSQNWGIASGETLIEDIMILEGDHTQNPPSYFEGLKSVGQSATTSEDDVDEVSVESVKGDGNLLMPIHTGVTTGAYNKNNITFSSDYSMSYVANAWGQGVSVDVIGIVKGETYIVLCDTNTNMCIRGTNALNTTGDISMYSNKVEIVATSTGIGTITFKNTIEAGNISCTNLRVIKKGSKKEFSVLKQDKKRLLYYNEETQTWEKPILRQWDSIEKHANDKYYYHQRSGEEDYTRGDESVSNYITDMTTTVKPLAEEKVYECTNIDLITYANETNFIVESGVLSPRTTLKVHNNISNVVSLLQKKVSLLESNVTSYMTTQNRLMLASRYNSDAVSFKVDYAVCSENMSQENYDTDLYNLILNNILVGKDNYDYNHMFNIIMDYASWSQISWDQFDILVGLMDIQHNPPIEEIPTDDEIVEEIPNEIM